jgi:hypothetical protein
MRVGIAIAIAAASCVAPSAADACSCPVVQVLHYPSAGGSLPANGVLVASTQPSAPLVLRDSAGVEIPIELTPKHSNGGSCYPSMVFARPLEPLTVGATFTVNSTTFSAAPPLATSPSDVEIQFEVIEHEPANLWTHYCAPPLRSVRSVGITLSFTAPEQVLLVASASSGDLASGDPVLLQANGASASGPHAIRRFAEDAPEGCGHAWVYDLTGSLLLERSECFSLAPGSGGASDGGPHADAGSNDDADPAGGCQLRRPSGSPASVMLAGLACIVLVRRRRTHLLMRWRRCGSEVDPAVRARAVIRLD